MRSNPCQALAADGARRDHEAAAVKRGRRASASETMEAHAMLTTADLQAKLLTSWRTNCQVTAYLVEHLPGQLWSASLPAAPQRTVRMVVAHLHNARSWWLRTLGQEHGIVAPALVDRRKVTRRELLSALRRSGRGIEALLELGFVNGGRVPPSKSYVWRNLPLDVGHVLTYFVAHEGHHRGQIVLLARELGHPFPREVLGGLWQWNRRAKPGLSPSARANGHRRR